MISIGARPNVANRAASGLGRLDRRYFGPVNVRSSSRGCAQLKVLDCASEWMLVRRASPRSSALCTMTRGIVCPGVCTSFRHARPWQQCQTGRRSGRYGKGRNRPGTAGKGSPQGGLCAARHRRVVVGPSQGSRELGEVQEPVTSCSLDIGGDRSERVPAGSMVSAVWRNPSAGNHTSTGASIPSSR